MRMNNIFLAKLEMGILTLFHFHCLPDDDHHLFQLFGQMNFQTVDAAFDVVDGVVDDDHVDLDHGHETDVHQVGNACLGHETSTQQKYR